MPDVLVRRQSTARAPSVPLVAVLVVVVCLITAIAVSRLTALPHHVARVTFTNDNRFAVHVEVAAAGRRGRLGLGVVDAGQARPFFEVVDQGSQWVLRFRYAGVDAGELEVGRADLARQDWKIAVPAEVGTRLAAAGLAPSEV